jgi:glycosidase
LQTEQVDDQPIPQEAVEAIHAHLAFLYGADRASGIIRRMMTLFRKHLDHRPSPPQHTGPLDQNDAVLITYGDQLQEDNEFPLQTLRRFLRKYVQDAIPGIHILPFFPYSSDEGFSIIDYRRVNPDLGGWKHIEAIASDFKLMVDAVINHVSSQSAWFQGFREGKSPYDQYFIRVDPQVDLSSIVRPRDRPLLTPVNTVHGKAHLWTTFSPDQIDLNFHNPEVLLQVVDILLAYIRHGVHFIRLDAIAFLWKVPGTTGIHLPQTHTIVKLLRAVIDAVAPWVRLITETNVPHAENVTYFGSGDDEAHLVYNFALPPLVLHTLLAGDATRLTGWACRLATPSRETTFFNFLASHDGIGLRPVEGLLTQREIEDLVQAAERRGGRVSYRGLPDGGQLPYEMNITYTDALAAPEEWKDPQSPAVARFMCSQTVMLSLRGLPAIYFHSLVGSRNDLDAVQETGKARAINRERLRYTDLVLQLENPGSVRARIFSAYRQLLLARRRLPAFDPHGKQRILDLVPNVFALLRTAPDGSQRVLCLHEIAGRPTTLTCADILRERIVGMDHLSGRSLCSGSVPMEPYQCRWIELEGASG